MNRKNKTETENKQDVDDYNDFLEIIEKKYPNKVSLWGKNQKKDKKEVISTGSLFLDRAILPDAKEAGYVRGKIFEIFGLQSSGKSTLALHATRECQKLGGKVVYFDLENGLDEEYAGKIGVQMNKLIYPFPESGEEAFEMMIEFVEQNVDMLIVDSVAHLLPRSQVEISLEKQHRVGSHASLMSYGLKKLKRALIGKKTVVIFINQLRKNISTTSFLPSADVTTGGMALLFDADVRLKVKVKEHLEKNDQPFGVKIEVKIVKNKLGQPNHRVLLEIIYSCGIRKSRELLQLAINQGVVRRGGNWYTYKEEKLGNGLEAAADYLEKQIDYYQKIKEETDSAV